MIGAFIKATAQINDPAARRVVWLGLGAAIVAFAGLWAVVAYLLYATAFFTFGWLETAADVLGGLATLIITWLLFPAVVSAVIGLFLEDIAAAVEARHFPHLPKAEGAPLADAIAAALKFLAVMVALNIVMLPFLLLGPLFPFVFYAVNGYLLAREYFELVALRRLSAADARVLRKEGGLKLFAAGVVIAFGLTVPVVNLLAPIVATAWMVHMFEGFRARPAG